MTATAVAAVTGGGVLAAAREPRNQAGVAAAPLSATPRALPQTTVALDARKLTAGRAPQLTYLRGRTIYSDPGNPVKVSATDEVGATARLWDLTLTVLVRSATSSSLVIQDDQGKLIKQVPKVDSLTVGIDGQYAAYASGGQYARGAVGGTVYYQPPTLRQVEELHRPKDYNLKVLAVVGHKVYFQSAPAADKPSSLYRWDVDHHTVTPVSKVIAPLSLTADGALAAGTPVFTDSGLCSVVTTVSTGLQKWRTCQYRLDHFSPSNAYVVGWAPGAGEPYGENRVSLLDAKTGKLLRAWTAPSIRGAVAEDDDHVLLLWNDSQNPQSRSAVVRCTVSTGQCELATPLSSEPLLLGS
ncbi:hypothetical protein AB0E69_14565 [Kribbella sp. NPDC026611]|uniref:hypothetical protein n=1 Tax=Kribbella sp. NPDC026611 TaxID=3154911 RepID=UPI0033FDA73E